MYDSNDELTRKITLGEDSSLELKAVFFAGQKVKDPNADSLADEMGAFANSKGGVILLGVDDKTREVTGIPIERLDTLELFVREISNDRIRPPLPVYILRMDLPSSTGELKAVIKIDIGQSLFVHSSPGGYLHRVGSSKRPMPPEYLARLFQQRSQARLVRFEEQAVPNTTFDNLSKVLYERFISASNEPRELALLKRGLLCRDERGVVRASVAGVLMCAESPEKHLSNAFIQAVRYRGVLQDSNNQLDALDISGPLDEQIRQALLFLRRNQKVTAVKVPHRIETPQFSDRAVFEAIVNAVAHRDYSIHGSKIRFFMFDDRLEIYSPGALPNTVTVETMGVRQATRNELITSLLAKCPVKVDLDNMARTNYMEKRGDGVPVIIRESKALSGKEPIYQLFDDSELLLTIFAAKHESQ